MAYSYGIPDGTYVGRPTTASCYEKDGRLILDVRFMVKDPSNGQWYRKGNGYDWEVLKRHWLTSNDGAFNEKTIAGIREWAKGWEPRSFDDFYWFQSPDENNTAFGHLAAIGEVELNFKTDSNGNQNIFIHDPNRPRAGGRKAYVPDGASADKSSLMAKWGTKAKALFAATPKKVATAGVATARPAQNPGATAAATAPQGGAGAPARPGAAVAAPPRSADSAKDGGEKPWAGYPQTCDGAFLYFCSLLGEAYSSAKHDERWFGLFDRAAEGKDPDLFTPADVQRLFRTIWDGMQR